jgi:hypothetical protein
MKFYLEAVVLKEEITFPMEKGIGTEIQLPDDAQMVQPTSYRSILLGRITLFPTGNLGLQMIS